MIQLPGLDHARRSRTRAVSGSRRTRTSRPKRARTVFETGSILDRFVFHEAESSGVEPHTRTCHLFSRPCRARLELFSVAEAGGLEPHAAWSSAHHLPSELRPRRIPLPWSGQGDLNPQPLGSGPSALARLSYTQVLSARWESNPERTRIRRPGLTETTRGSSSAATVSSSRGGPSANRTQCELLIREPRVTNPSWPDGTSPAPPERGRHLKVPTRGFEPPLRGA